MILPGIGEVDVSDGEAATGQDGHPGIRPATDYSAVVGPGKQSRRMAQVHGETDEEAALQCCWVDNIEVDWSTNESGWAVRHGCS